VEEHLNALCLVPKDLPGSFQYSLAEGEVLSPGRHRVEVRFTPVDRVRYSTTQAAAELVVLKIGTALRWSPPRSILFGTPLSPLQLNAEAAPVPGSIHYEPAPGAVLPGGVHVLRAFFAPFDSAHYEHAEACVNLTVHRLSPTIVWDPPESLPYGMPLTEKQLSARVRDPCVPGEFLYSPGLGQHRALLKVGLQTLTCQFVPAELASYHVVTASVQIEILKTKPELLWDKRPRFIKYGTPLNVVEHLNARYADPTITADFSYDRSIGEVLDTGPGRISLIVRPHDRSSYYPDHKVIDVFVEKAVPAIDWPSPPDMTVGEALTETQLNARCLERRVKTCEFLYEPPLGTKLRCGVHVLSVRVNAGPNYVVVERRVQVTVRKAAPSLHWSAVAALSYGTAINELEHLNARAFCHGESIAGSFSYEPPRGTVLSPGLHSLTARFEPESPDDYFRAEKTIEVSVTRSAPAILWEEPGAIEYGTPLTETQLNARLDSALEPLFAAEYEPAAGAQLSPGRAALTVTYRPLSEETATKYVSASKTVHIEVQRIRPTLVWSPPLSIQHDTALTAKEHLTARCEQSHIRGRFEYFCDGAKVVAGRALPPGAHKLRAEFVPEDSALFAGGEVCVDIVVEKREPVLRWEPPAEAMLYLGVPMAKQTELCNAQCLSDVAGRFYYQVRESHPQTHSCVVQARFTPNPEFQRFYKEAVISRSVAVGGSYADWAAALDGRDDARAEHFLYTDDRVFTLHHYNSRHFTEEPHSPFRQRRIKSAKGERSQSPIRVTERIHSAQKRS
jgi:hypothetical protein